VKGQNLVFQERRMSTNDQAAKPSALGAPLTFVLPMLALLFAQYVRADDGYFSPTDDRVRLSLGAMHVSTSTTVRADSSAGITGTVINGENEFGLDKSDFAPKIEATLRVTPRQRLTFDYFSLDRTGNAVVGANPIVFRDVIFFPSDPLQTTFSLRTVGIAYEYSFWHSEKLEIAATLGRSLNRYFRLGQGADRDHAHHSNRRSRRGGAYRGFSCHMGREPSILSRRARPVSDGTLRQCRWLHRSV
jgi:hypothetical protein